MLLARLQALEPLIADICRIAGTPGLSWGVLHHGEVVHQAGMGLRDVEAQLPALDNTVYLTASLTKAFTAAMVGILVDEGKLNWTTQLQHVLPNFQREDPAANITLSDVLSHRTGLPSYDSLWLLSDNKIPIDRSEAIPILSSVPAAAPLRTEWLYNNMAYEVVGQVIERVSGKSYAGFLQDRILEPLGMESTFYTDFATDIPNAALPYTALRNATPVQVPQPISGKSVLMGPAGGVRSSIGDLLLFYTALIDAAHCQFGGFTDCNPLTPLKQMDHIWQQMVSLQMPTLLEYSYASGWARVQLPAALAPDHGPVLGKGLPSRLGLFHGGNIPGFMSFAAIFPETSSAVIVLSNSLALSDTTRLVGQLLIEELFGNTINATDYIEYATSTSRKSASVVSDIKKELLRRKTVDKPSLPLHAYTGTYYNSLGNFFIEIRQSPGGQLKVYFMGLNSDSFDLEPYQHNSFFWHMSHDDLARRARQITFPKEYYILEFFRNDDSERESACDVAVPDVTHLRWKHEAALQGQGEAFTKRCHQTLHGLREQQPQGSASFYNWV